MAAAQEQQPFDRLNQVVRAYGRGAAEETKILLTSLRPADLANLLAANPPKVRQVLWELLDEEPRNQTLQHLSEELLSEFLGGMDTADLVAVADDLDTDDFADILQQLHREHGLPYRYVEWREALAAGAAALGVSLPAGVEAAGAALPGGG